MPKPVLGTLGVTDNVGFQDLHFFSHINRNFPLILPVLWCVLLRPGRIYEDIALLVLFLDHRLFFFFIAHGYALPGRSGKLEDPLSVDMGIQL